jgi:parallel beta-helix repeat protein
MVILASIFVAPIKVYKADAWAGTVYIKANGDVEPIGAPVSRNGDIYTLTWDISSSGDGIVVERDNMTLDGNDYAVQGVGTGISLSKRTNVTIYSTQVKAFSIGIFLNSSSQISIVGNSITNNKGPGIKLSFCSNNYVVDNTIRDNQGYGISFYNLCSNNSVIGNNIRANHDVGIWLESSSNNSFVGNNVANHSRGGIYLWSSSNIGVVGNNVTASYEFGIYLNRIVNSSIFGNHVEASNRSGIFLDYFGGNDVFGNNVTNNECGIGFFESCLNRVIGNIIVNNQQGIGFWYLSNNNSIIDNDIAKNELGIDFMFPSNSNNSFYHNVLVNNIDQVKSSGDMNLWDDGYPSGGNYWSDYDGTDSNNDGIGTPEYVIDADNVDHYPLMGMFSDFNATSEHDVQILCNSTITDFHFNSTAIRFNVSGQNGTAGFCRICVPRALINSPYEVFVNGTKVQCNELNCSNGTHAYLYFNYTHSTKEVIIISEYRSFLILPLFMVPTLIAVIAYRRKRLH